MGSEMCIRDREREREVDASTDDTTPRVALSHARIRRPHTVDDDPMGRVCVCVSIDLLTVHDSPTSPPPSCPLSTRECGSSHVDASRAMSRRSTDRARPREHPLCSFAACVPPKDHDDTRVRCVSTSA